MEKHIQIFDLLYDIKDKISDNEYLLLNNKINELYKSSYYYNSDSDSDSSSDYNYSSDSQNNIIYDENNIINDEDNIINDIKNAWLEEDIDEDTKMLMLDYIDNKTNINPIFTNPNYKNKYLI